MLKNWRKSSLWLDCRPTDWKVTPRLGWVLQGSGGRCYRFLNLHTWLMLRVWCCRCARNCNKAEMSSNLRTYKSSHVAMCSWELDRTSSACLKATRRSKIACHGPWLRKPGDRAKTLFLLLTCKRRSQFWWKKHNIWKHYECPFPCRSGWKTQLSHLKLGCKEVKKGDRRPIRRVVCHVLIPVCLCCVPACRLKLHRDNKSTVSLACITCSNDLGRPQLR